METTSAQLTLWLGNPLVTGRFWWQRAVNKKFWSFLCFLSKQAAGLPVNLGVIMPMQPHCNGWHTIWHPLRLGHDDVIKWKPFPRYWPFVGNSPITGEFPAQRPVTRSFDVFFDLRQNKWLSKHLWGWWFETPSRPLRRHCNGIVLSAFMCVCVFVQCGICRFVDWL